MTFALSDDEVREAYILAADATNADRDNGEDYDAWLAAHDAEVRASVVAEAAGYYVIPKASNPDQDSLWDGTIHPTREAAQASLDEARADWGQDAENYRVVAWVPVEQEEE